MAIEITKIICITIVALACVFAALTIASMRYRAENGADESNKEEENGKSE